MSIKQCCYSDAERPTWLFRFAVVSEGDDNPNTSISPNVFSLLFRIWADERHDGVVYMMYRLTAMGLSGAQCSGDVAMSVTLVGYLRQTRADAVTSTEKSSPITTLTSLQPVINLWPQRLAWLHTRLLWITQIEVSRLSACATPRFSVEFCLFVVYNIECCWRKSVLVITLSYL